MDVVLRDKQRITLVFFVLSILTSYLYFFYTNTLSVFVVNIVIIVIVSYMYSGNRNILLLISFFLLIYLLNNILQIYYQNALTDSWNLYPDEITYYNLYNIKNYDINSILNNEPFASFPAFIIFLNIFSYIEFNFFKENDILYLKTVMSLVSIINLILLYKIYELYFSKSTAFIATLIFSLFSFSFIVSGSLMRDQLIATTYLITFYLILKNSYYRVLFLMIPVIVFSYFIRKETGLFLLLFYIGYFLYMLYLTDKKIIKSISYFVLIGIVIWSYVFLEDLEFYISSVIESYSSLVNREATESSLGKKIYNLPYGLNYIFLPILSQIQPFPIWSYFNEESVNLIFKIQYCISSLFWLGVMYTLVVEGFKDKKIYKTDRKLLIIFIISILFLIIVSSIATDIRRLYVVYPIFFLMSGIVCSQFLKCKLKLFLPLVVIYCILIVIYMILKIIT